MNEDAHMESDFEDRISGEEVWFGGWSLDVDAICEDYGWDSPECEDAAAW